MVALATWPPPCSRLLEASGCRGHMFWPVSSCGMFWRPSTALAVPETDEGLYLILELRCWEAHCGHWSKPHSAIWLRGVTALAL